MIWMPTYLAKEKLRLLAHQVRPVDGGDGGRHDVRHLAVRRPGRPRRWKIFVLYQVGAVVMVIGYAQLSDPMLMLFAGTVMGMFVSSDRRLRRVDFRYLPGASTRHRAKHPVQSGTRRRRPGAVLIGAGDAGVVYRRHQPLAAIYLLDIYATLFLLPKKQGAGDTLGAIG